MKRILIVGGANGIGLSLAKILAARDEVEKIYVVDKEILDAAYKEDKIISYQFDLRNKDFSIFNQFSDVDGLIITVGFGQLALFEDIPEDMIEMYFSVNTIGVIRIIKHFYKRIISKDNFYCSVMVSIAGFMSSPFFSLYAASKAALKIFIESVNVELIKSGTPNRILNVSPGFIEGTSFYKKGNDPNLTAELSCSIIENMLNKNDLYIPKYKEIYKEVLDRYKLDFRKEGCHSYDYKLSKLTSSDNSKKKDVK